MKLFLDMEFTGLHQNTTPISLALVSKSGEKFYAEFEDYKRYQIDDWLKENVIDHLWLEDKQVSLNNVTYIYSDTYHITVELRKWLSQFDIVEIWGDCLGYDWVLFCELFGGALYIPSNVYYIPFDICTLFLLKGIDPDISRRMYGNGAYIGHNALYDALMIKACYERLVSEPSVI